MDRNRQQWRFPTGNAAADGASGKRERHRLGIVARATNDDKIQHQQHPRSRRTESGSPDGLQQPRLSSRKVNIAFKSHKNGSESLASEEITGEKHRRTRSSEGKARSHHILRSKVPHLLSGDFAAFRKFRFNDQPRDLRAFFHHEKKPEFVGLL